jgi:hypothetical protein
MWSRANESILLPLRRDALAEAVALPVRDVHWLAPSHVLVKMNGGRPTNSHHERIRHPIRCLDKEDLCVAKLCTFREKDQNFVAALVRSALVDGQTILSRLTTVDERYRRAAELAASWLRSLETGS